ncbi:hypothetical protein F4677DRAFT_405761 [Hypoxylon crocopeplum]|nr:hypothetical protein F4677DRAFT_405761 [Hypoxylon crocopeplum]
MPSPPDQTIHPVWVVTGASSGIGQAIALEAVRSLNAIVFAIGRNEEALRSVAKAGCRIIHLDIASPAEASIAAVNDIVTSVGRIDVLVNAAGYLLEGSFEETSDEEAMDVFQTNFFGPLRLTRAVLPHMRRAGSGAIFNVAGIAAYSGSPNAGLYCATKAAITSLTEALQAETDALGVRVCLVQLGHFRTAFLTRGHRLRIVGHIDAYDGVLDPLRKAFNGLNGAQPGDPLKAARVLVGLAAGEARSIPFFLPLGPDVPLAMQRAYEARVEGYTRCERLTHSTNL